MENMQLSKRYILDISRAKLPDNFFLDGVEPINKIPLVNGVHVHEFDIVMEEVPVKYIKNWYKMFNGKFDTNIPIGVNRNNLPTGAIIYEEDEGHSVVKDTGRKSTRDNMPNMSKESRADQG